MGIPRKLLVIADDSPEWGTALMFAAFRARNTGAGVVVLRTLEPTRFEHWAGVREEIRRQNMDGAEAALKPWTERAREAAGIAPEIVLREGALRTELKDVLGNDHAIKILVLATDPGPKGPGPLIASLSKKGFLTRLGLPIVVIPGGLGMAELEALA